MQTLKGADSVPAGEACGCPERPGAGSGVGSLLRPLPPGKPPPLTQPFPHQTGDAGILPACLPFGSLCPVIPNLGVWEERRYLWNP